MFACDCWFARSLASMLGSWGLNDFHTRTVCGKKTVDGRLLCTIYITSMIDITIHQNAVASDDIYNVLPFCIAVCDHTERVNLPLESQDGVDAIIDNVEVYLIESGDGVVGFQVQQFYLDSVGNHKCKCLELDQDLNVNGRPFQPLGLVTHINVKQWVQIDEIRGVNVAVADKTVHVEVVFSELCDILVHSGDLSVCVTGIEVYRWVAFCVESDVDSSQPAVVSNTTVF
ncbi:unnamed protein product [Mytilus edulis]|uniref:Uncharacterized protein n=1 Tax=Mytilus edulis TaxID=6550 RepID=A0A8S3SPM1_MYTED|nr:unnamed protein product [Mytilus edulis]